MSGPSKESLRAEARELAAKLGGAELPADLDAMKQEPLLALVAELAAQLPESDPPAFDVVLEPVDVVEEPAPAPAHAPAGAVRKPSPEASLAPAASEAPAAPKAKQPCPERCRVCEGKMVVCLKGPVGALEHIRDFDLAGGRAELEQLFAAGVVEEAKR